MTALTPEQKQRRSETIRRTREVRWEAVKDARVLAEVMWFRFEEARENAK